jgi:5-formyltetrahydrofolate cyclo-ligase
MVGNQGRRSVQSISRNVCAEPNAQTKNAIDDSPKRILRATLLANREAHLADPARPGMDDSLAARLLDILNTRAVSRIGFYWPVAGEFDARDVVMQWLAADDSREAALPVVVQPHAPVVFHAWRAQSTMKEGRYRIPVPADERMAVPELLLIPCVAFDEARFRLGYGGGYYDRTLAAWPVSPPPMTIGVAFEAGKCDALPRETHDMPLDAIVTEAALY